MNDRLVIPIPGERLLETMINEEEEIRTSQWYRDECTKVRNIPNGWLEVTESVQRSIAQKHGFIDQMMQDIACNMTRRAHLLYPMNDKFKKRLQIRNNKSNRGTLTQGDDLVNVQLFDRNQMPIDLNGLIDTDRRTIIFAGSQT